MANDNPTSSDQVIPAAGNPAPYLQNRELSWLDFNERVLEQGADESVPLLQRLNFISIFWSNLQEFFMVRVGSLTDLSLVCLRTHLRAGSPAVEQGRGHACSSRRAHR